MNLLSINTPNRALSFQDLLASDNAQEMIVDKNFKIQFNAKEVSPDYKKEDHAQDYKDKKDQCSQELITIHHFIYKQNAENVYYNNHIHAIFSGKFTNANKRKLYLSMQLEKTYYLDFIQNLSEVKKKMHQVKSVFLTQLISIMQSQTHLHFLFESYTTTLEDLLSFEKKTLPENQVKFYTIEILEGLGYLHSQDVFYIDLHPSNIYITDKGHIKLSNCILRNEVKRRHDESKVNANLYGNAGYIAPEVLILLKLGSQADLWSLGVLLYRLSFGCLPFPQDNSDAIYFQMYKTNKASYTIKKDSVPIGIRNLISKLLIADPSQRLGGLQGVEKVKNDPWFKEVGNWKHVSSLLMIPPCIPTSQIDRTKFFPDNSQFTYDKIDTKSDRRPGLMIQQEKKDEFKEKMIFGDLMWDVTRL